MAGRRWIIRKHPNVQEFIEGLDKVPRENVQKHISRLERYGERAPSSLSSRLEGAICYLRVESRHHGSYRIFYFKLDESTAYAFDAYQKRGQQMPQHVHDRVMERYRRLTGEEP